MDEKCLKKKLLEKFQESLKDLPTLELGEYKKKKKPEVEGYALEFEMEEEPSEEYENEEKEYSLADSFEDMSKEELIELLKKKKSTVEA
jgi:hypothetical protein